MTGDLVALFLFDGMGSGLGELLAPEPVHLSASESASWMIRSGQEVGNNGEVVYERCS